MNEPSAIPAFERRAREHRITKETDVLIDLSLDGTGSADGNVETCPKCRGTGQEQVIQNFMGMQMRSTAPCSQCGGKGKIIKTVLPEGQKRYDFQFVNKRGYKITVEGLSEKFNPEYWNYAKLISGVLRYRMPIAHVIKLVNQLQLTSETLNTWRVGVERALKKYLYEENGIENKENGIDNKETEDEIDEQ